MTYFALEGGVCAGKTTLIGELAALQDLNVLPDYMELLGSNHPAKSSLLPPAERLPLFLELEQKRNAMRSPHKKTLGDRSILSIIAFEYAMYALGMGTDLPRFAQASDYSLAVPDCVLVLDVSAELRSRRWYDREADHESIFIREDFNNAIHECLARTAQLVNVVFVDATELQVNEIISYAKREFNQCYERDKSESVTLRQLASMVFR